MEEWRQRLQEELVSWLLSGLFLCLEWQMWTCLRSFLDLKPQIPKPPGIFLSLDSVFTQISSWLLLLPLWTFVLDHCMNSLFLHTSIPFLVSKYSTSSSIPFLCLLCWWLCFKSPWSLAYLPGIATLTGTPCISLATVKTVLAVMFLWTPLVNSPLSPGHGSEDTVNAFKEGIPPLTSHLAKGLELHIPKG